VTITVSALHTYPIKSCGALSHAQIALDERGPAWDRRWMVVDSVGVFITQRELPALAPIQPSFAADCLRLSAPGMPDAAIPLQQRNMPSRAVRVWRDTCDAMDEGDDLAAWLSDYLGAAVRLVRMADGFVRPADTTYAPPDTPVGFADGFPLLLVSDASLDDLNQHLQSRGKMPVPMSRFRPNVVISGCEAFAEDGWRAITIGSVTLDIVKPCARCVETTVDQSTGTIPDHTEPLATLNTYRKRDGNVLFAQNAIHRAPGVLRVGDTVSVIKTNA
jgi:uncharacterized protein YcbX